MRTPPGWTFVESGDQTDTTYRGTFGNTLVGDTYSTGAFQSPERSFSVYRGKSTGNMQMDTIGATFRNTTGATIEAVNIAYTGEQWTRDGSGNQDFLDVRLEHRRHEPHHRDRDVARRPRAVEPEHRPEW